MTKKKDKSKKQDKFSIEEVYIDQRFINYTNDVHRHLLEILKPCSDITQVDIYDRDNLKGKQKDITITEHGNGYLIKLDKQTLEIDFSRVQSLYVGLKYLFKKSGQESKFYITSKEEEF